MNFSVNQINLERRERDDSATLVVKNLPKDTFFGAVKDLFHGAKECLLIHS